MKLGYKQVADFLKRPKQAAGVLIYGPDEGLVRERVKTIIAALLGEKPDPFSIIEITEAALKENPTKLFEEASAMGFLVNERVIVLRNPPEKIAPDIESIIATLDPSTYLIVSEAELTPRAPMRQLFEQHQKLASLACYKDEAQDISAAVRAILTKHGLAIRPDALQALTQRLGNDRAVTSSEAEKIALYKMGESEVTLADIDGYQLPVVQQAGGLEK